MSVAQINAMCNKIIVSFCWKNNRSKTSKSLVVMARYEGDSNGKPRAIASFGLGELIDPNERAWSNKRGMANQRFKKRSKNAEVNNSILSAINLACDTALAANPKTLEEFWSLAIPENVPSTAEDALMTFGGFISDYIQKQKTGDTDDDRCPSANHQVFITLLHHLEREDKHPNSKHIIKRLLTDICDKDFKDFGDYLRKLNQRNYVQLMAYFKRMHNYARKKGLVSKTLTYDFRSHKPKIIASLRIQQKGKKIETLTPEQITEFENLDIDKITLRGPNNDFYKQLYKDTALLMYYLFTRPVDTFSLKHSDILHNANGYYIDYVPSKKSNNDKAQKNHTQCPISDKAMAIIERYKGMSKGGYVLPFSANNRKWDNIYVDPVEYLKRYRLCNDILYKVNSFLKKVAETLNIVFENDTFTLYIMRHSAITHAINRGKNPLLIAQIAGTSVEQIEEHYYDHTLEMFNMLQ